MAMPILTRLAVLSALCALGALSACHSGGDDPPAAPPPPAPTVTIAANPPAVQLGSASTITWSSTNSTSCTAAGAWTGTKATSGTESAMPPAAGGASYSLTCTGSGGSASAARQCAASGRADGHADAHGAHRSRRQLDDTYLVVYERNELHSERRMERR